MPEDLSEMKRYAKTMFDYAAKIALKENFQKIVIFLDALNQMDDDGNMLNLLVSRGGHTITFFVRFFLLTWFRQKSYFVNTKVEFVCIKVQSHNAIFRLKSHLTNIVSCKHKSLIHLHKGIVTWYYLLFNFPFDYFFLHTFDKNHIVWTQKLSVKKRIQLSFQNQLVSYFHLTIWWDENHVIKTLKKKLKIVSKLNGK